MSRRSHGLSRRGVLAGVSASALARPALGQPRDQAIPDDWPEIDPAVLDLLPNQMTRMAVPVGVNGQGPFYFVVDTGANRTTISQEVAEALGLAAGPPAVVHGVVSAETARTVHILTLDMGPTRFRDLAAPVFPGARLGADGLLGVDVLKDSRLVFQVSRGQLSISPSIRGLILRGHRASRLGRSMVLRARQRFGQLTVVDVRVDETRVTAFVDSGSQYTIGNLALLEAIGRRRPEVRDRRLGVPIIGVTGQTSRGEVVVVRRLELGSSVLYDTPVVFADLHAFDVWDLSRQPALLLGADVMGRLSHVTLDFGRNEMEFGEVIQLRPSYVPGSG